MADLKTILAQNVRRLRDQRDLTQEELAHQIDISGRYMGSIERAQVAVSITVLGRIADTLGVSPCDLLSIKHTLGS